MGGFWGLGVALSLVVTAGLLVWYRQRAGTVAALAGLALLGFVAILPQSNELRYFQFIPLSWAAAIGMLYPHLRLAHPRATIALLGLVLTMFGYVVSENLYYYYVTPQDSRAIASFFGVDRWWPLLEPGTTYCAVEMPVVTAFLMTGPTLNEYSIVARSDASLCPADATVVTKAGIQGPAG